MGYEYSTLPKNTQVTYLKVISHPTWNFGKEYINECPIKVGDITWCLDSLYHIQRGGNIHLEGNRWNVNFKNSCFKVIDNPSGEVKEKIESIKEETMVTQQLGKWYKNTSFKYGVNAIWNCVGFRESGTKVWGTGINLKGEWRDRGAYGKVSKESTVEATEREVQLMIYTEARKRGLDIGAIVNGQRINYLHYALSDNRLYSEAEGEGGTVLFDLLGSWVSPDVTPKEQIIYEEERYIPMKEVEPEPIKEEGVMYRFKTEEEFRRDGLWNGEFDCPDGWAIGGQMNKSLGEPILSEYNSLCREQSTLYINQWEYLPSDYVTITTLKPPKIEREVREDCIEISTPRKGMQADEMENITI